jgi:hypothetical protein
VFWRVLILLIFRGAKVAFLACVWRASLFKPAVRRSLDIRVVVFGAGGWMLGLLFDY